VDQRETRLLAAIMFTDMVGYTALMQHDEQRAIELRRRHRQVLEDAIRAHEGKILQYFGDGTLAIFSSAVEAARCAVAIQHELQKEPKIPLRIGLHVADIVYNQEGVYGDGVNVAARIEALAVAGGVVVSDRVYEEIKNHPSLPASSLGMHELKHVERPVELFALTAEGLVVPTLVALPTKRERRKALAVLPFVNMSPDPENEYFADGITEELLNALAKLDTLQVTSRTSAFAFKGRHEDIREIGQRLGVESVLEGSVRKAGKRVRITAQLISAHDGYHLWSETYDRELEDIFQVQDEIARAIVVRFRQRVRPEQQGRPLVAAPTTNMEAYTVYLKGLHFMQQWSPDSVFRAIDCFSEAASLEPTFSAAHNGVATGYLYLGALGQMMPRVAYERARGAAQEALRLDEGLAEAHTSLGAVHLFNDWDWDGARREFERALELNPNSSLGLHLYSMYLAASGSEEESLQTVRRALELDPISLPLMSYLGEILFHMGRLEEARRQAEKALEIEPRFRAAINVLGDVVLEQGDVDRAIALFKESQRLTGDELKGMTNLGYAYAQAGRRAEAEECLARMREREARDGDVELSMDFALVHRALGQEERAMEYLERGFERRVGAMVFLRKSSYWRSLRDHPRFAALVAKIGIPSPEAP